MADTSKKLLKQLQDIELFSELSHDDLRAVAELFRTERYPVGSVVCRQGQLGQTAYLIESGVLRAVTIDPDGREQEVNRLRAGEFFGKTSLLLGEPRDATVEVVHEASLLVLSKSDFEGLLREDPSVLRSLVMDPDVDRKRRAPRFRWQDPDEVVILSMHKHNAILLRNLVLPFLALVIIVAAFGSWFLGARTSAPLILGSIISLAPLGLGLYFVIDHFNDDYVVTSKRVLHEERIPLIREARAEAPLRTVQNIHQTRHGIWAQIYNYGDLIIETAGERGHVVFSQVANPTSVQEEIFEQIRRVQAGARAEERTAIRDAMERQFGRRTQDEQPKQSGDTGKSRGRVEIPGWIKTLFGLGRYFLPPLRYEEGETITWRKHWIALLRPISIPSVLIMIAAAVTVFLLTRNPGNWPQVVLGYGISMMFLLPWWLWQFDDWQNDIYQLTNTRIIDVERQPFFLREDRREASLGVVQNIKLKVPGLVGKIFNFGSVTIETAGVGPFTFEMVKDPRSVQAEIFRRMDTFQRLQREQAAEQRQSELLDWFTVYNEIRDSNSGANPPTSEHPEETQR